MSVAEAGVRSLLEEGASPRVSSLIKLAATDLAFSHLPSERIISALDICISIILTNENSCPRTKGHWGTRNWPLIPWVILSSQ